MFLNTIIFIFVLMYVTKLWLQCRQPVFYATTTAIDVINRFPHPAKPQFYSDYKYIGFLLDTKSRSHFLKLYARQQDRLKWEYFILFKDPYGMESDRYYLPKSESLIDHHTTVYIDLFEGLYTFHKQHLDDYPYASRRLFSL